ncbi:MAG: ATP-dependent helicase HrpB, partial [Marinospirillum sp.]|uniref:ATP-dependent helicase C-terminal domain-containing protein n=1 Tax=Marinospirillum sp. TaxID=2183934 RepID=UPI001A0706C4
MLLNTAKEIKALPLACWLVSLLEERLPTQNIDLLHLLEQRPRQVGEGAAGRWYRAAQQWARRANCKLEPVDLAELPQLLLAAYPDRLAQSRGDGRFKLVTGGQALLAAEHPLAKNEWLVAVELDGQVSGARVFQTAAVPAELVAQHYPQATEWQVRVNWDEVAGRVVGEEIKAIGELVFMRRPLQKLPEGKAASVLLQVLQQKGVLPWSATDQQLLGRLRLLNRVLGDPWPDVNDQQLLQSADLWLLPRLEGMTRMEQLEKAPLGEWLLQSLDWQQQQALARLAPTHLKVPSGSRVLLDYSGDEPVMAVKLQELFGQTETPRLVDGRV